MKKCPKCGAFVGKTQEKCRNCGFDLLHGEIKKETPKPVVKQAPTTKPVVTPKVEATNKPREKVLVARKVEGVIEIVICPRCGGKNVSSASYCTHCGQKLGVLDEFKSKPAEEKKITTITCPNCGKENVEDANYCAYCAKALHEEVLPKPVVEEPVVEKEAEPVVEDTFVPIPSTAIVEEDKIPEENVTNENEKTVLVAPCGVRSKIAMIFILIATLFLGVIPLALSASDPYSNFFMMMNNNIPSWMGYNTFAGLINYCLFVIPAVGAGVISIVALVLLITYSVKEKLLVYHNFAHFFAYSVALVTTSILMAYANSYSLFVNQTGNINIINVILTSAAVLFFLLGFIGIILRKAERASYHLFVRNALAKTILGFSLSGAMIAFLFVSLFDGVLILGTRMSSFALMFVNLSPNVPFDGYYFLAILGTILTPIFLISAIEANFALASDAVRYRTPIVATSLAALGLLFPIIYVAAMVGIQYVSIPLWIVFSLAIVSIALLITFAQIKKRDDVDISNMVERSDGISLE